jgi:hypothetical protein
MAPEAAAKSGPWCANVHHGPEARRAHSAAGRSPYTRSEPTCLNAEVCRSEQNDHEVRSGQPYCPVDLAGEPALS